MNYMVLGLRFLFLYYKLDPPKKAITNEILDRPKGSSKAQSQSNALV